MSRKVHYPATHYATAARTNSRHVLNVLACAAALFAAAVTLPASAGTDEEIARIENGLRPVVALAGAPVPTKTLADEMRRLHVPGVSVAVSRDGKIAWARGFGVAHENGPAITADTLFQAASVSKPVTGMTTLRLAEEGRFDLDADVNTFLTSWRLPPGANGEAGVSLRQLLSHTAGITVPGFPGYAAGKPVPTLVQVLEGSGPANTKPVRIGSAPGSAWRYSGGGYSVVQQALVDRTRQPFDILLAETILKPIGMTSSSFAQPLPAAWKARAALPHDGQGRPFPGGPYTYPELAAAGLWTTPTDLARFALDLQRSASGGKGVLSPAMARTMLQPVKNNYGMGVNVGGDGAARSFSHGGTNMGYQNVLFAYANRGDGAIVMTNGANGSALAYAVLRAIAFEYGWPSQQTVMRTAVPLPEAAQEKLAGHYDAPGLGSFRIARRDGQLMVSVRGDSFEPLYAASPTVLFVLSRAMELRLDGEGATGGRVVGGYINAPFSRAD
jgi:CubicO group peptidase (beta-lactamase class C family)